MTSSRNFGTYWLYKKSLTFMAELEAKINSQVFIFVPICCLWASKGLARLGGSPFCVVRGTGSSRLWLVPYGLCTVKPVWSGHSKIEKTKILMTNGSLMKVESVAECSKGSILQYFQPSLSDNWYWNQFVVFLRVAVLHRFYCTDPNMV